MRKPPYSKKHPNPKSWLSTQLPVGYSNFVTLRQSHKIYVDKTKFIYELAHSGSEKYFLIRPEKFGKTLLCSAFESLFKNREDDFSGLYIGEEWLWGCDSDIIRLDFSKICDFTIQSNFYARFLHQLSFAIKAGKSTYWKIPEIYDLDDFADWLEEDIDFRIVLIIDNYDAPLRDSRNDPDLFREVRTVLFYFFSLIEREVEHFSFVFITGTERYSDADILTVCDILEDLTLSPSYGSILGFTSSELMTYFLPQLQNAAKELSMPVEEVIEIMGEHYGGYCFEETCQQKVFSPYSVFRFLSSPSEGFRDFKDMSDFTLPWFQMYIDRPEFQHPKDYVKPKTIDRNSFSAPSKINSGSREKDWLYLFQVGYLTLKDVKGTEFVLDYPNKEIADWLAVIYQTKLFGGKTLKKLGATRLMASLQKGDVDTLVKVLNKALASINAVKFPINDAETCRKYFQLILTLGENSTTYAKLSKETKGTEIHLETQDVHWIFDIKFLSEKNGSVEDTKIEMLKELCQFATQPDLQQDSGRINNILLGLVYSEKERQIVSHEATMANQ